MVGTGTAPRPTWLGADLFPLRALVSVAVLGAHHARPPSCLTDEETGSEGTVSSPGTPSLQELGRDSGPGSANSARVLLEGPSCSPVRCPASGWSEQAPGPARGPGLNGSSVPARQLCCPAPPPSGPGAGHSGSGGGGSDSSRDRWGWAGSSVPYRARFQQARGAWLWRGGWRKRPWFTRAFLAALPPVPSCF